MFKFISSLISPENISFKVIQFISFVSISFFSLISIFKFGFSISNLFPFKFMPKLALGSSILISVLNSGFLIDIPVFLSFAAVPGISPVYISVGGLFKFLPGISPSIDSYVSIGAFTSIFALGKLIISFF